MPYYRQLSRLAQSPLTPGGIPVAITPVAAVSVPSSGGVPVSAAPAASTAGMPPGTVLRYSAQLVLAPNTAAGLTTQQMTAQIGAQLAPLGIQLAQNKMPALIGRPQNTYSVTLTVQLLNSFPTVESVQGAIDNAVNSVPGLSVLSSAAAVAGTSVAGQTLGPATPEPSALDNLTGFVRKNWPWLTIGGLLLVGYSEKGTR